MPVPYMCLELFWALGLKGGKINHASTVSCGEAEKKPDTLPTRTGGTLVSSQCKTSAYQKTMLIGWKGSKYL